MQAARSVLNRRHAIVIGPTPPGTGVMAPATSSASAKLTSPTMRDLPPALTRLMPISITVEPGRIQSPRTDSDAEDLGAAAQRWQIAAAGMRDRHRSVFLEE